MEVGDTNLFNVFDEDSNDSNLEVPPAKKVKTENTSQDPHVIDLSDSKELDDSKFNVDDINVDILLPRIKIHTVETLEVCVHEVAVPPDVEYVPLSVPTSKPAKEYKFILDPFQKEAILCIENRQSVLVSAHTSAGKTVVAEYSIALSLRDNQRVIYTTPIKALSNQKFREFTEEFQDVGLITGDVTINPNASCIIMTTEILRNMLYRGSELMREVGWVVFDEIHYMRDKERGVVWEETLILLPDNVHYVFLSATIPNATQFAEWVAHLHHQPCHVVYTDYRPVPLQHYIFPAGGEGIHLVVDESGQFIEQNFNAAMTVLQNAGDAAKGDQRGRRGGVRDRNSSDSNIFKIVRMIMERDFAPVIVFSFSKKECEVYALQMAQLDFNTAAQKKMVDEVFNNAMDVLSPEDRKLPQVENLLPLLRRGIGIHHGGLLPILKETVEILFAEGLIKALFATETFAMGLNMPARTVVFSSPRKFDGKEFRWLTSGEYIQMSGRAGRRGQDDRGIVILMIDEKVSPQAGRDIVKGSADPIYSAFHLTYNMVLNLLRVEEINPEYMLERSFFQFQNQTSIPQLIQKLQTKQAEHDQIVVPKHDQVASYCNLQEQLCRLRKQVQSYITKPEFLVPFLQPGRMVKIVNKEDEFDWGIVINFNKQKNFGMKKGNNPAKDDPAYVVEVLLHVDEQPEDQEVEARPCPPGKAGEVEVVPVVHTIISQVSSIRLHIPKDLKRPDNRKSVLKSIQEVKKRFDDKIPLLDPVNDMHIKNPMFVDMLNKMTSYEDRLLEHPLRDNEDLGVLCEQFAQKSALRDELKKVTSELKAAQSVLQMDELKCRKRVLRRLGYCTEDDVIKLKGRVACELNGADELLMTEMIFNGVFNNMTPAQCASILSCFVCDEKSSDMPKMSEELSGALRQMQDMARRISRISNDVKLELDEETYVNQFKPFLMDVVYAWCNGASFLELCKMTDIFEGSIIRCFRRLEEVLRQLCQAAKTMGNAELDDKFSECIKLIKRDIIFAASLYL
ncbi:exosome RNA helicase MTR4 [Bacillus rossius redtenbacheri]|uniref:exosome RNA helicase MTR4 n=1 Tax=Bacillus rossius redtenbacheri TaxID=93214 RepID=UPI002FDD9F76